MSTKYEQLLDLIVNEETEKAEQLFHDIVVEQSRQIYENLLADADQELGEISDNGIEKFVDDIQSEEEEITAEGEEEGEEEGGEEGEVNVDFDGSGKLDAHEENHGDVEERIDDLEDLVNELQRAIDELQSEEETEHADGAEEMSMDMAPDSDMQEESVEVVREYKEKVGEPFKGGKVAAAGKGDGEKSPVATKGGTMPTAKGVDFAGGDEKGRTAPTAKSMNSTTEPNLKKVGGGADAGKGDGAKSPVQGV